MKKRKVIYVPLMLSFLLVGCTNGNNEEIKKEPSIAETLKELKGNLTINGRYTQKAFYENEIIASSDDSLTYKFLNDERRTLYTLRTDGDEEKEENIFVMGEDGYAYTPLLNYKNEEILKPIVDNNDTQINFSTTYSNPFLFINEDVLTKKEESSDYILDSSISNYIFKFFTGNVNAVKTATLKLVKGHFASVSFEIPSYEGYIDYEGTTVKVNVTEEFNLNFSDINKTEVNINNSNEENVELKNAFTKLGNNYTLKMTRFKDGSDNYVSYFYFTGSEAYLQYREGNETMKLDRWYKKDSSNTSDTKYYEYHFNKDSQTWAKKSENGEDYIEKEKYADFLPKFSEISSNLFIKKDYTYVAIDKAVGSIAEAICPPNYQGYANFIDNAGTNVEINLSNGNLSKIMMHSQFEQFGTLFEYDYTFEISNIGTTALPSFVK